MMLHLESVEETAKQLYRMLEKAGMHPDENIRCKYDTNVYHNRERIDDPHGHAPVCTELDMVMFDYPISKSFPEVDIEICPSRLLVYIHPYYSDEDYERGDLLEGDINISFDLNGKTAELNHQLEVLTEGERLNLYRSLKNTGYALKSSHFLKDTFTEHLDESGKQYFTIGPKKEVPNFPEDLRILRELEKITQ